MGDAILDTPLRGKSLHHWGEDGRLTFLVLKPSVDVAARNSSMNREFSVNGIANMLHMLFAQMIQVGYTNAE